VQIVDTLGTTLMLLPVTVTPTQLYKDNAFDQTLVAQDCNTAININVLTSITSLKVTDAYGVVTSLPVTAGTATISNTYSDPTKDVCKAGLKAQPVDSTKDANFYVEQFITCTPYAIQSFTLPVVMNTIVQITLQDFKGATLPSTFTATLGPVAGVYLPASGMYQFTNTTANPLSASINNLIVTDPTGT
jgi:hypothetical protein